MMKLANDSIQEEEIDQSLIKKRNQPNNSGYLQQHYETTKDFPNLHQFHFRIEDQHEIMQLEKLKNTSEPMNIERCFLNTSAQFQTRLNSLIAGIDSNVAQFKNQYQSDNQRFYLLADHYPQGEAVQQAMQKFAIKDLSKQVQNMSIGNIKASYPKKQKKVNKMIQQKKQLGELQKKFKRMTINFEDL